ncbi:MAG: CDP-alcohol phosphatidyltransferase family protein [Melioribacteraceae bacterium]|nr:CDP-alcohol phosphatidyltransferase family protein [Melioribacteraceae bacterium]
MKKWYKEYISALKMLEVEEIFDLIFYRPLAFLLVKLVYPTNITPNQLTIIAVIFGLAGGIAFGMGTSELFIIGGILYILYDVFDCSDGQLARLKRNGTKMGRILDGVADYIATTAAYLGIGFGFAGQSEDPGLYWALTVGAGIVSAVQSIMLDYYRNRFLDIVLQRESVLESELKEFQEENERLKSVEGKKFEKMIIGVYLRYSEFQMKMTKTGESNKQSKVDKDVFYKKNKKIMHLWTYIGPTSQLTFMIVCALINRFDIYLIGQVTVGLPYALLMFLIQNKIDKEIGLKG